MFYLGLKNTAKMSELFIKQYDMELLGGSESIREGGIDYENQYEELLFLFNEVQVSDDRVQKLTDILQQKRLSLRPDIQLYPFIYDPSRFEIRAFIALQEAINLLFMYEVLNRKPLGTPTNIRLEVRRILENRIKKGDTPILGGHIAFLGKTRNFLLREYAINITSYSLRSILIDMGYRYESFVFKTKILYQKESLNNC
jgi:hypothetical protein